MNVGLWIYSIAVGVALTPLQVMAQEAGLPPAERSEMVSAVLQTRVRWFEDHTRVDPCSVARATGDDAFLDRMDARVRHLFMDLPYQPGCAPLGPGAGIPHVQVLSVTGPADSVVVKLLVNGRGVGSLPHEYRMGPLGWTIQIERPFAARDRASAPLDPPLPRLDTLEHAAELSALEAALQVIPSREDDVRIVIGETAPPIVRGGVESLTVLASRVDRVRWFADMESAQAFCDRVVDGARCMRSQVDSIARVGAIRRVFITSSALGACGYQEY